MADYSLRQYKTHRRDAWQPLTDDQGRLRALLRHRDDLLQTKRHHATRLLDATDALVRASLAKLLTAIGDELAARERSSTDHLAACAELQATVTLLTTVVGIGVVTATKLLGECGDVGQYGSAKSAAADGGLTPSDFESGTSVRRRPKMSKQGKAGIRAALYWPAITAMRHCPAIKAVADKLAKRGKPKKVIIGAVMRKLVHICYGVLENRTPYDPSKVSRQIETST